MSSLAQAIIRRPLFEGMGTITFTAKKKQ